VATDSAGGCDPLLDPDEVPPAVDGPSPIGPDGLVRVVLLGGTRDGSETTLTAEAHRDGVLDIVAAATGRHADTLLARYLFDGHLDDEGRARYRLDPGQGAMP
jgi:hypothetical protein